MNEIHVEGDTATLTPQASITAQTSEDLKSDLKKVYEGGANRIVIDLKLVERIDSIGLGLLAATHNSLQKRDSKLELINAGKEICKVLNLMRLDRHFIISCTPEAEV